jgi:hypothetical protein
MAVVHVIGAGAEAGSPWLQIPLALTMAAVLALLGHRILAGRPARGARPPRRAPVPAAPVDAPTQPLPAALPPGAMAASTADQPVTTVAPAPGYRPLWARDPSPPPRT